MKPDLLALVYGWFTKDFDTLDLKEAKAFARRAARLTANFETASKVFSFKNWRPPPKPQIILSMGVPFRVWVRCSR